MTQILCQKHVQPQSNRNGATVLNATVLTGTEKARRESDHQSVIPKRKATGTAAAVEALLVSLHICILTSMVLLGTPSSKC